MVQHIVTQEIGNLRGFSTDNTFIRPPNVAEIALNLQRAPDKSIQLRRGYQCQIAAIGGMGIGTFDNPAKNQVQTVTIGTDGFLYNKLTKQIYLIYDGQVTGTIIGATQANPCEIHSINHNLITGTVIIIRDVNGMIELNNNTYTITFVDADHFTLNGVDSTGFTAYVNGGYWSIAFADKRYLNFTIFTDPRYIYQTSLQSITCDITVHRAAQVNGNQSSVNTIVIQYGSQLQINDVVQFLSSTGIFTQRNVTGISSTSITIDGAPVTVLNGTYINQFFDILFGKGYDTATPYLISQFISVITDPVNGIFGLQVNINGDDFYPAAFLQIVEPTIIDSNSSFSMDYWYWQQVNYTVNPPFPGSANLLFQNSQNFENASFAAFNDIIYISNGIDYPQKYDGQTVYRTGMPVAPRPSAVDDTGSTYLPFSMGDIYQYAITYEQVDNLGHIVEGEISEIWSHTIIAATASIDVTVNNLTATTEANWNTNTAVAQIGTTQPPYGPDIEGFYYAFVPVSVGYTLKIGDSAYYYDEDCAIANGTQTGVTFNVDPGHGVLVGDTIYFPGTASIISRIVTAITPTSITFQGDIETIADDAPISVYKTSKVFGNVAIVLGNQNNVNIINVQINTSIQAGDVVNFIDSSDNPQMRNVTGTGFGTITIDGNPVSIENGILIASENQRTLAITLQRTNPNTITFNTLSPISNNLRINIYRTKQGQNFNDPGIEIYLVVSLPNNGLIGGTQTYDDELADTELNRPYEDPEQVNNPPPISKYLRAFRNQLFYGGGQRENPENSDRVFFSKANEPESVPLISNSITVPNVADDITGLGVSGTTFVITKGNSLWAVTGDIQNPEIIQIAQGTNIGCISNASIASVGTLMYFLHTNGVYAITENQLFPTDAFGNPIPLSLMIDKIFRETNYLPQTQFVLKRSVAINYTKDNQYWLFLPCESQQSTIRTANAYSIVLCYDYQGKNWYRWENINAAGGMVVIDDYLYFQERRNSNTVFPAACNLYKQHRFYRLIDHADHAGAQYCEWRASWEDLGQPEVRKKFSRCILLMDRLSSLYQYNQPIMEFSSYIDRISNLRSTFAVVTTVDNIRNSPWSISGWGWNFWSGYEDTFVAINLKRGTVCKSMQVGFTIAGIDMDIKLSGYQLEAIPENRKTVVR